MGDPVIPVRDNEIPAEITAPLDGSSIWMKITAVMMIIQGALTCLTIIGILFAWVPILMGVILWQAANAGMEAHQKLNAAALIRSLDKLKVYFIINGILSIIGFAGMLIFIAVILIGLLAGDSGFGRYN